MVCGISSVNGDFVMTSRMTNQRRVGSFVGLLVLVGAALSSAPVSADAAVAEGGHNAPATAILCSIKAMQNPHISQGEINKRQVEIVISKLNVTCNVRATVEMSGILYEDGINVGTASSVQTGTSLSMNIPDNSTSVPCLSGAHYQAYALISWSSGSDSGYSKYVGPLC